MKDLIGGLESGDLAIVLVVYIVVRELFVFVRARKEGADPVSRVHTEVVAIKRDLDDIQKAARDLISMHLDPDSKFATVHLSHRLEEFEHRVSDTLRRIELAVERRHS